MSKPTKAPTKKPPTGEALKEIARKIGQESIANMTYNIEADIQADIPAKAQADVILIIRAASFAAHKHRNQRRKDADASPYINHPLGLARVLSEEGGITDAETICVALLHDTIEDTDTTPEELKNEFGARICALVLEVTDDKSLTKVERKLAQIEHAAQLSNKAKFVRLADKICNLRDVALSPPPNWPLERKQEYFHWAKRVIDNLRGVDKRLESVFDAVLQLMPQGTLDG